MLRLSPNGRTQRRSNGDDDVASIGKLYGVERLLSMLVDFDIYACVRLMLEAKHGCETRARVPV